MKIVLLIVGLCLIVCDGRIVKYRAPFRNQRVPVSYEDQFSDTSQEAVFDDDSAHRAKVPRTIEYQPSYGYSRGSKRKYISEDEIGQKKGKFLFGKSRGRHLHFEEIPEENFFRESPSKSTRYDPVIGDRKKEHRSIPRYESVYQPQSAPPAALYYKSMPPKQSCPKNVLIGCTPTVTRVPCGYPMGDYPNQGYYPSPMIGSTAPDASSHPYQGPYPPPAYHSQQSESPRQAHGFSQPPPSPKSTVKPPPTGYQPNEPMYRVEDSKFRVPSFSPPVREDLEETSQTPFISAFPTTTAGSTTSTTKSAQLRVQSDEDEDEGTTVFGAIFAKEGSGEEMGVTAAAAQQTTSTVSPTSSTTPA